MKPIQLRSNFIDADFKDSDGNIAFTIRFDRKDENIERLMNFEKEFEKLNENFKEETATLEEKKEYVKTIVDSFLEEGSFDKLYNSNPSLEIVMVYLFQIVIGIKEELEAEDLKALENKYLKEGGDYVFSL